MSCPLRQRSSRIDPTTSAVRPAVGVNDEACSVLLDALEALAEMEAHPLLAQVPAHFTQGYGDV